MSSTRRAKDDSVFHQSKYASSPEFEHGLTAYQVAKRCQVISDRADRELVWFVQYLSLQPGGLAAVASDLVTSFKHHIGPATMVALRKGAGDSFTAEQVRKIRVELPVHLRPEFPLRGEIDRDVQLSICHAKALAARARHDLDSGCQSYDEARQSARWIESGEEAAAEELAANAEAQNHPITYTVASFWNHCARCAEKGGERGDKTLSLEHELARLCLDPAYDLTSGPWYFSGLMNALRDYHQAWVKRKSAGVVTAIGEIICESLDRTLKTGILSLQIGQSNLGIKFAARAWCELNPGKARIVDVPPSNDEASFFRAIAQALGLANCLSFKNIQIRERVEYVLQTGDILLVLNSAQFLWPQKNLREAFPGRLAWLLDQCDKGLPASMISGPQFFMQKRACEKTGWNSPEFRNRIGDYVVLPEKLDIADLTAVARAMLPEAEERTCKIVAVYASTERYLAAVEIVAKRALFIAKRAGRTQPNNNDVREALEMVSHSDAQLRSAFEQNRKAHHNQPPAPAVNSLAAPIRETVPSLSRETTPATSMPPGSRQRAENNVELIPG